MEARRLDVPIPFLQAHENNAGYVNCDVKESREGKLYVELNAYKKGDSSVVKEEPNGAGSGRKGTQRKTLTLTTSRSSVRRELRLHDRLEDRF